LILDLVCGEHHQRLRAIEEVLVVLGDDGGPLVVAKPGMGRFAVVEPRPRDAVERRGRHPHRARSVRGARNSGEGRTMLVDERLAAATMIGAVTMSRMVTDPVLSAEILREAEKSLMAARS